MIASWREKGLFDASEQRLSDQVRKIIKKGWLTELQLEEIRRRRGIKQPEAQPIEQDIRDRRREMEGSKEEKETTRYCKKRRKIDQLRKDLSLIERWKEGKLKKESKKARLERLYKIKNKGFKRTAEELKQAKSATVKRYTDRIKQ